MGSPTPNVSRDNFDPLDQYAMVRFQQGVPVFDNDLNEASWTQTITRSFGLLGLALDNQSKRWSHFTLLQGTPNTNNFAFNPGYAYGHGFPYPHRSGLPSGAATTFQYNDATSANLNRLSNGVITAINGGANTITDGNKSWKTEHRLSSMGGFRVLMLSGAATGTVFTITAFTAGTGTLTIGAGIGAIAVNDLYAILPPVLTTPGGSPRTDTVYLMTFLEDTNADVDTDIDDPTLLIEAVHKLKVRCCIVVDEGTTGVFTDEASASFPQDPRLVRFTALATFARLAADNTITTGMITHTTSTKAGLYGLMAGFEVDHVGSSASADFGYHDVIHQPDANLTWHVNSASDRSVIFDNDSTGKLSIQIVKGDFTMTEGTIALGAGTTDFAKSGTQVAMDIVRVGISELHVKNTSAGAGRYAQVRAGRIVADTTEDGVGIIEGDSFVYGTAKTFAKSYDFVQLQRCLGNGGIVSSGGNLVYNNGGFIQNDTAGATKDLLIPVDLPSGYSITGMDIFGYKTGGTDVITISLRSWALPGTAISAAIVTFTYTTATAAYAKQTIAAASGPYVLAADTKYFWLVTIGNDAGGANRARLQDFVVAGTVTNILPVY